MCVLDGRPSRGGSGSSQKRGGRKDGRRTGSRDIERRAAATGHGMEEIFAESGTRKENGWTAKGGGVGDRERMQRTGI